MPESFDPPERYPLSADAWIDLWPGLLAEESRSLEQALFTEIDWQEERYRMFGREVVAPRRMAWHGDSDASYSYSGLAHEPLPWTPSLQRLRGILKSVTGLHFNSVLANLYRNGADGMGWHADNEREVGPSPLDRHIASISFGASRRFLLRHEMERTKHEFLLGGGDLLVMRGSTQSEFKHSIPKTAKSVGLRINLTFRKIRPPSTRTLV